MGWLIGILIFVVSWVMCFVFTYKAYHWDMTRMTQGFSEQNRKDGVFFASLHIVGVFIALGALIINIPDIMGDKIVKEDSFIGKCLRKLEK